VPDHKLRTRETLMPVLARATLHCPWYINIWIIYLYNMVRLQVLVFCLVLTLIKEHFMYSEEEFQGKRYSPGTPRPSLARLQQFLRKLCTVASLRSLNIFHYPSQDLNISGGSFMIIRELLPRVRFSMTQIKPDNRCARSVRNK